MFYHQKCARAGARRRHMESSEMIKKSFGKNNALGWKDFSFKKIDEYFIYAKKCNDYLRKVYNHYTELWNDKLKSEKVMGDFFTYGSFISLILTCGGSALGIGITARTIIQAVGAVFTVGSVALKLKSKLSYIKYLNYFRCLIF